MDKDELKEHMRKITSKAKKEAAEIDKSVSQHFAGAISESYMGQPKGIMCSQTLPLGKMGSEDQW